MSWLTTVHNGNTATKEQRVSSPDLDIDYITLRQQQQLQQLRYTVILRAKLAFTLMRTRTEHYNNQ